MRNNLLLALSISLVLTSCGLPKYLPKYLPTSHELDVNKNGSYIKISQTSMQPVAGELISVESNYILLLSAYSHQCVQIPIDQIEKFNLQFALPHNYRWTIPVFSLFTISHGLFLGITLPFNLIFTGVINANAKHDFAYTEDEITYEELKMFARFPQGVPSTVDISQLK